MDSSLRAAALAALSTLTDALTDADCRESARSVLLLTRPAIDRAEQAALAAAIWACGGNLSHAASWLGMPYRTAARWVSERDALRVELDAARKSAKNVTAGAEKCHS
jgi:transcriptional regulator of acetoin/glycerol metabolism